MADSIGHAFLLPILHEDSLDIDYELLDELQQLYYDRYT